MLRDHSPSCSEEIPAKESEPDPHRENGSPLMAVNVSSFNSKPAEKETLSLKVFVKSAFWMTLEKVYPPGLNVLGLQSFSAR